VTSPSVTWTVWSSPGRAREAADASRAREDKESRIMAELRRGAGTPGLFGWAG
jgi:hypothetical protein